MAELTVEVVHIVQGIRSVLVMTSNPSFLKSHLSGITKRITLSDPRNSQKGRLKRRGGNVLKGTVGMLLFILGRETVEGVPIAPINHPEQKYDF